MSGKSSHSVALGDRGRFVVPNEVRERHGWSTGTPLVVIDTDSGVVVLSTDEALAQLRERIEGRDLVSELLAERRLEIEGDSA